MSEDVMSDLRHRLGMAGWCVGGQTRQRDKSIELKLRIVPDTSGEPVRSVFATSYEDAIRTEVERLEAERAAGEP